MQKLRTISSEIEVYLLLDMDQPRNPLAQLDHKELVWLFGILKDACRERLEKNQVSQAFEERLYQRGPVAGRLDPRPFLKIWEPRYRKFLEVASEVHAQLQAEDAREVAETLRTQFDGPARKPPAAAHAAEPEVAAAPKRRRRANAAVRG